MVSTLNAIHLGCFILNLDPSQKGKSENSESVLRTDTSLMVQALARDGTFYKKICTTRPIFV